MKRAAEWTYEELEILLGSNSLAVVELSGLLPGRSLAAVQVVRSGIHQFHQDGDSSLLTKRIKAWLTRPGAPLSCPMCGERLNVPTE